MRTEEVFSAVNQALLNYHKLHRLTDSPLSQFLQIPHGNAGTTSPSGYSVRYLLDQAIDHISGVAAGEYLKPRTWHMEHYLHLRYRQKVQHKEIAGWLGYTERHLHRLRQELVQEVAQYIIQQAKMSGVS